MNLKSYARLFTSKPCDDATEWLKTQESPSAAWQNCHRGDWLWWALRKGKDTLPAKEISVAFANWCATRAADAADAAYAYAAAANAYAANAAANAADAAYAAERLAQANWIRANIDMPESWR